MKTCQRLARPITVSVVKAQEKWKSVQQQHAFGQLESVVRQLASVTVMRSAKNGGKFVES